MENEKKEKKGFQPLKMNALWGVLIFVLISAAIAVQKVVFDGNMGAMFLMLWIILIPIGLLFGHKPKDLVDAGIKFAHGALRPVFIFLTVGALISTWIASGTTPALIYYGIKIISPKLFLVTAMLLCSVVSLVTGTSNGTAGTAGLAMIGIGTGLGIPPAITAGAVFCGAMFGDKMSPMSDTTILASSISKVNIFKHIRHMLYDQIPAYLISIVFFLFIGFKYSGTLDLSSVNALTDGLKGHFNMGFWAFIPLIVTVGLMLFKVPSLLAMLSGAITAIVVAIFYQGVPVADAFNTFYSGFSIESGNEILDKLLNRGGIADMWSLAGVTLFGFTVAGMLQHMKALECIANALVKRIRNVAGITVLNILFGFLGNAVAMSQNFAIVMTGTLMAPVYPKYNLQPKNCSRDLEVGGTYGALFIPWNVNTIFMAGVLGVGVTEFIPYIPLLYLTPIIVIVFALFKFRLTKIYDDVGYVDVSERLENDPEKQAEISGL